MGREKIIERGIRKYLKKRGYLTEKIHVGQYGPEGFPDLLVIRDGVTSYFEIKKPGEVPSPIQRHRLKELKEAGCIAAVVWSLKDVCLELDQLKMKEWS